MEARASGCPILQSYGLYDGAKVVRGHHWKQEWGDQDGGQGKEGKIIGLRYAINVEEFRSAGRPCSIN